MLKFKNIRKNYILVDLICHGIPTIYLWRKYLNFVNKKYNMLNQNHDIRFRNKNYDWRKMVITISNKKRCYKNNETKDDFYAFFRRGACYNKSCFECPYREKSSADIRIGDYWGNRFKKDTTGVSMVIVNTSKGEEIIRDLFDHNIAKIKEYSLEEYWNVQYPYNQQMPIYREEIIRDLKNDNTNLHELRKKYHRYDDAFEKIIKIKNALLH